MKTDANTGTFDPADVTTSTFNIENRLGDLNGPAFCLHAEAPAESGPSYVSGVMYQLPKELHHMNIARMLSYASTAVTPFYSFSEVLLDQLELDPKLRQLTMLRVAQSTKAHSAWIQHVALAQVAGVSDEQISSLQQGRVEGEHFTMKEQVALAFVDEVLQTPRVSNVLFEQMWRLFSSHEMVELLLVVGLSWMAGRVMTTFDIEPDSHLRTRPLEMILTYQETQRDERSSKCPTK